MSGRRLVGPRALSYIAVLGVGTAAWALISLGMHDVHPTAGGLPLEFDEWLVAWVAMLMAIMVPSIAHMVVAHACIQAARRRAGDDVASATTTTFVCGYVLMWTAVGIAVFVIHGMGQALTGGALSWHRGGPWLAAALLTLAATYQLTPRRDGYLAICRSPIEFVLRGWHDGPSGSLRMGAEYGLVCIRCSAPMIAALFALGATHMTWLALIAAAIVLEKLGPWRRGTTVAIAGSLVGVALAVAIAPADVSLMS